MSLVQLWEKLQSEMPQAIKQKSELLDDDPISRLGDGVATWMELVQAVMTDENE